jgi:hypothetical protein
MSKHKDFISKYMSERRNLKASRLPAQNSKVSMFNNQYKMLTKSDSEICILEDSHGNKVAYPRDKLLNLLDDGLMVNLDSVSKALPGTGPKPVTSATPKSTGATPKSISGKRSARRFPIGTIRNGRKKINEGVWVDVSTGHYYGDHETKDKRDFSTEHGKAQVNQFMKKLNGRILPEDKPEIEKRLNKLIEIKNRVDNLKKLGKEHAASGNQEGVKTSAEKITNVQNEYKESFKSLQTALKNSHNKLKERKQNG